ncbi:hypothetical protein [Streptomyces sp. NPDC051636]|uniref:hypothetical protein n=1 Tax=Streptomyces sp. NPDC051636 TaxID=3365663 RepID=UPI003796F69B
MAAIPQDLLDRIRELERKVRELAGRSQIRPALTEVLHGDIVIGEGGQLMAKTPAGQTTFIVGDTKQGDWGVGIGRQDGSAALTVGDDVNGGDRQMIRMWSRDRDAPDRILVMDDAFSDRFLGRPWLPFPMYPTANAAMQGTTSWQFAWLGRMPVQNAVAVISFSTISSAGGQVRINYVPPSGNVQTINTWTVPSGSQWINQTVTQPLHGTEWGDSVLFQIEHRNSASTGAIETRMFSAYTRNTFSTSEAPDAPVRAAAAAVASFELGADAPTDQQKEGPTGSAA